MEQETLLYLANLYASRGFHHVSDLFFLAAQAAEMNNQRIVHGLVKIACAELSRTFTELPSELVAC